MERSRSSVTHSRWDRLPSRRACVQSEQIALIGGALEEASPPVRNIEPKTKWGLVLESWKALVPSPHLRASGLIRLHAPSFRDRGERTAGPPAPIPNPEWTQGAHSTDLLGLHRARQFRTLPGRGGEGCFFLHVPCKLGWHKRLEDQWPCGWVRWHTMADPPARRGIASCACN